MPVQIPSSPNIC